MSIFLKLGNQKDLFKEIKDKSVKAIVTDPPYSFLKNNHKLEANFDIKEDLQEFLENCDRVLKDDGFLVYFGRQPTLTEWNNEVFIKEGCLFEYLQDICWFKISTSNPYANIKRVHENIIICRKKNSKILVNLVKHSYAKAWGGLLGYREEQRMYTMLDESLSTFKKNVKKLAQYKTDVERENFLSEIMQGLKRELKSSVRTTDETWRTMGQKRYDVESIYPFCNVKEMTVWGHLPNNKKRKNVNILTHPTVKPIPIIERLLLLTTEEEDLVLDPFCGSGTTLLACRRLNRQGIGFEIDKDYYKVAQVNLQNSGFI